MVYATTAYWRRLTDGVLALLYTHGLQRTLLACYTVGASYVHAS